MFLYVPSLQYKASFYVAMEQPTKYSIVVASTCRSYANKKQSACDA